MTLRLAVPLFGTDGGRSGLSTYTRSLLPALLEAAPDLTLELAGTQADLEALAPPVGPRTRWHVTPAWTRARLGDWAWLRFRLSSWARAAGADLVFFPAGNRRVLGVSGLPSVATVHDLAELVMPEKYGALRRWRVEHEVVPALRDVTGLIAVSETTRAAVAAATGHLPSSIAVVENGVDRRFTAGPPEEARARIAARLDLARPYLLYVARLEHPAKNHVTLLEAFAAAGLARTHDLALVGADWPGSEVIHARIAALGLGDAVRRPGFVAADDLPDLYRAAEGLTFVSRFEGFGLPLVEAMASGCPVLASDREPMRGVVGPAGILVDPMSPADVARGLLELVDRGRQTSLRTAGLTRASRWSWDRAAVETLEVLRAALGPRRGSTAMGRRLRAARP